MPHFKEVSSPDQALGVNRLSFLSAQLHKVQEVFLSATPLPSSAPIIPSVLYYSLLKYNCLKNIFTKA